MVARSPAIDLRRAADIRDQVRAELYRVLGQKYGWSAGHDTDEAYGGEACNALVHIFAQYCEHVIDRINRNRDKSFLAFLDLMGNTLIPAQAARTVVSFTLAAAARGRLLPAGTRVQALAQGAGPACNFETEHDVWLSNLHLQAAVQEGKSGKSGILLPLLAVGSEPLPVTIFDQSGVNRCTFELALTNTAVPREGQPIELYFWLDSPVYDAVTAAAMLGVRNSQPLCWSVAAVPAKPDAEQKYQDIAVEDETAGLTRSGVIRLLTPDASYWRPGGKPGVKWFALSVSGARQTPPPRLRGVALNSVSVVQATTVEGEVLGSSAGQTNQRYFAAQTPILPGAIVAVLETPSGDAAQFSSAEANWVAWQEVPDFFGSGPVDRHYVLDHQSGELRFGDGKRGMAPPSGARNVRLSRYRTGGGAAGNVAAGLLKIPVSNTRDIATVTNFFAASGGADAEQQHELLARAPRSLRHRQRAVTRDDYQDLALQASTEVARARCVPLHNLLKDAYQTLAANEQASGAGDVSVIIVPHSTAPQPLPTLELITRVRDYLRSCACVEAAVEVTGPLYLPVDVSVRMHIESARYTEVVRQEVRQRLAAYLHPLTGGRSGKGWQWGRGPKESDFYAVLDGVAHVTHFDSLTVNSAPSIEPKVAESLRAITETRRFLVCAGTPKIDIVTP